MNINTSSHSQSIHNLSGFYRALGGKGSAEAVPTSQKDTVSFSEEALRLSETANTNTESTRIRFDIVNRVKAEIAAGTYDTPEKMDIAIDRMASRIF